MIKSTEVEVCRDIFYILGREEKLLLLKHSNLTNRERKIMTNRYVIGLTAKETADNLHMDINAFNQAQKKIYIKLYRWLIFSYTKYQAKKVKKST